MSEHEEQMIVVQWAKMMEQFCPELALLFAIPNEQRLGWIKRGKKKYNPVATRLKQEGMQGGIPDLCLPVPRQGYHGLYIEMKFGKNMPTEDQRVWLVALVEQGYRVDLDYGADMMIDALCNYLDLERRFF